jgi:hypothetical protein
MHKIDHVIYDTMPDDILPLLEIPQPDDNTNTIIFSHLRKIETDYEQVRIVHAKKTDDIEFLKKIISLLEADKVKVANELRQFGDMHAALGRLVH